MWGRGRPAGRRSRGKRGSPLGCLSPAAGPGAGALQEEEPLATGVGYGQPGRRVRPHYRRGAMILLKSRQEIEQMTGASTVVAQIPEAEASGVRPTLTE